MDLCKKKDRSLSATDDPEEVGDFFVGRCVKRDTQLRMASQVGKNDEQSARDLRVQVEERSAKKEDPLWVSDGDGSIPPAMWAVFGKEVAEGPHQGPRWKKPRREPAEGVLFARALQQREGNGRWVDIVEEVTWGDPEEVGQRLDPEGEGRPISTSSVERDNLTSRWHNRRLTRKRLRFSKERYLLEAAVALEDAYFNFCLPHDALKRRLDPPRPTNGNGSSKKGRPRTPMRAEGLTDHLWTLEELLSFRVPPRHLWTDP